MLTGNGDGNLLQKTLKEGSSAQHGSLSLSLSFSEDGCVSENVGFVSRIALHALTDYMAFDSKQN